ncbi:MAG: LacI family transcriptional regulator [Lachnospiraceae bacterium]|nr:LacI family transcriptional regulator [Lachnospiraceae bacterium]
MSVTIYDVAHAAGVSIATVSKALNDSYTISEETKQRIRDISEKMDYKPNARAKSFACQANGTVLFLADMHQNVAFENPHMFEIISGIVKYFDKKEYSLTIKHMTKQDAVPLIREMIQKRTADAMIIHVSIMSSDLAALLLHMDYPYLILGKPDTHTSVCWLDVDQQYAGQLADNYLLDKGYRRMAFIMGKEDDPLTKSRLDGMNQIMSEEELSVEAVYNSSPYAPDEKILDVLLKRETPPEVLICSNNHLALQCLQHIGRLGMKIPEQIALLTFDNYPFSMLTDPQITAVDLDMFELGMDAARFILRRIKKPNLQTQSYCTSPSILERETT